MPTSAADSAEPATARQLPDIRHSRLVRITHWINALAFPFLLVSGLAILIAHPELYWGETGYFGKQPALSLGIAANAEHTDWGRNVHFLFAWIFVLNGIVYVLANAANGHIRRRLLPSRSELGLRSLVSDIGNHLRPEADEPAPPNGYNLLQKYSYLFVIFIIGPFVLLTGLTMSPAIVAAYPELLAIFGGRQSARTLHFILANLLTLFLVIHLLAMFRAGARRLLWPMISGGTRTSEETR